MDVINPIGAPVCINDPVTVVSAAIARSDGRPLCFVGGVALATIIAGQYNRIFAAPTEFNITIKAIVRDVVDAAAVALFLPDRVNHRVRPQKNRKSRMETGHRELSGFNLAPVAGFFARVDYLRLQHTAVLARPDAARVFGVCGDTGDGAEFFAVYCFGGGGDVGGDDL